MRIFYRSFFKNTIQGIQIRRLQSELESSMSCCVESAHIR